MGNDDLIRLIQEWTALNQPGRMPVSIKIRFHDKSKLELLVPVTVVSEIQAQVQRPLSDCERDILSLLESEDKRMKQDKIVALLSESEPPLHGAQTVRNALARLTKEELLINPRDGRGYALPDWE